MSNAFELALSNSRMQHSGLKVCIIVRGRRKKAYERRARSWRLWRERIHQKSKESDAEFAASLAAEFSV